MLTDFDVIVVGAGHNGLISAAYLAKAGYSVGVFERRHIVGGAVSTEELIPGYQIDLGGSAHILIRLTPIVEELGLEQFGLEYLDLDPLFFSPFRDGDSFYLYRDVQQTVEHLESKMPGEGKAYGRFIQDWLPFAQTVKDIFLQSPSPFELGKSFFRSKAIPDWKQSLPQILKPYGEIVDEYFSDERLKASLVWMAAQSGPPPTEPITAPFLLWHPLYHEGGIARPRGGSGILTQALQKMIEHNGGKVFLNTPITSLLAERKKITGVGCEDETFTSRAVVCATHAHETFNKLLPVHLRPERAKHMRIGNGFGAIVRLALDSPVEYRADSSADSRVAMQLLCESRQQIMGAYGDYVAGRPAQDPPIVAMSFSAVDDSLAPPGCEVLWLWGQYYPYELASGTWDQISDAVEQNIIDTFENYAPGTKSKIVGSVFEHPLFLERELGLFRGNVMHLEMSLDQMFMLRPFLNMAQYRSHLKGLYLTGASTHPGGGIMGASGRNTARVVLGDLETRKV